MFEADERLREAYKLEDRAKILRQAVKVDGLMRDKGPMSKYYQDERDKLHDMETRWNALYGGVYL